MHAANDERRARRGPHRRVITGSVSVHVVRRVDRCARVVHADVFGLGLTLAVAERTLVRIVVPAFMHVTGRWVVGTETLAWLHERFGVSASSAEPVSRGRSHAGGLGLDAGRSDGRDPASLTRNG